MPCIFRLALDFGSVVTAKAFGVWAAGDGVHDPRTMQLETAENAEVGVVCSRVVTHARDLEPFGQDCWVQIATIRVILSVRVWFRCTCVLRSRRMKQRSHFGGREYMRCHVFSHMPSQIIIAMLQCDVNRQKTCFPLS